MYRFSTCFRTLQTSQLSWCEDAILFLWVTAYTLSCYWLREFRPKVGISCVAKWAGLICIGLLRVVRARFAFSICTNFYLYYLKCFCFLLRHFFMYVTVASLISDYVIYMDVSFQCLVVLVYLLTRGSKQDMIQKLNTINKSHTTKIGMSLVQTNIFNYDKREVRKKWNIRTISLVMHSKDIMLILKIILVFSVLQNVWIDGLIHVLWVKPRQRTKRHDF